MKVLMVNTSEEAFGQLHEAMQICREGLIENGIDVEDVWLGSNVIHPCTSCGKCIKRRKCLFDGVVNEIADKSESFNGLIVGADVLFGEIGKQCIDFLNCLFRSANEKYVGKVGAVILSSRKNNTESAYQTLNAYFSASCMPVVTGRYWNTYCLREVGKGTQEMRQLAQNMSWLVKCVGEGKKNGIENPCIPDKLDEFMRGR